MLLRSLTNGLKGRLYQFSSTITMGEASSGRFANIIDRINRKSRRKEINQFLQVRLQSNYKLPVNAVSLKQELRKAPSSFKIEDFFLDLENTPIKFEPWRRNIDLWYIQPRQQQLFKTWKDMTNKFVVEVLEQRRDNIVRAEPNFELQLRKNVKSLLNAGGQIVITPVEGQQNIQVLYSELYKGLKISRNENYEEQSYEINITRANEGLFTYLPVKEQVDRFPENINSVILKTVCKMNFPFKATITYKGKTKVLTSQSSHLVTFENQLRSPPLFSEWTLSPEQYLQSYRFNKPWVITDIDNSNKTIDYLYPMSLKNKELINTLEA